jgi:hypothetical protein
MVIIMVIKVHLTWFSLTIKHFDSFKYITDFFFSFIHSIHPHRDGGRSRLLHLQEPKSGTREGAAARGKQSAPKHLGQARSTQWKQIMTSRSSKAMTSTARKNGGGGGSGSGKGGPPAGSAIGSKTSKGDSVGGLGGKSGLIGGSRSRVNMSSQQHQGSGSVAGSDGAVRVFLDGKNVTPQSLVKLVQEQARRELERDRREKAKAVESESAAAVNSVPVDQKKLSPSSPPTPAPSFEGGTRHGLPSGGGSTRAVRPSEAAARSVIREVPKMDCKIVLCETSTMTLLEVRSSAIATDSRSYDLIQRQNAEYEGLLASRQAGSDRFMTRATQTVRTSVKNKEVTAAAPSTKDVHAQASTWEIFDEQRKAEGGAAASVAAVEPASRPEPTVMGSESQALAAQAEELVAIALATPGCLLETDSTSAPAPLPQKASDGFGSRARHGTGGSSVANGGSRASVVSRVGTNASSASKSIGGQGRDNSRPSKSQARSGNSTVDALLSDGSFSGSMTDAASAAGAAASAAANELSPDEVRKILAEKRAEAVLASASLLSSLRLAERMLVKDAYHQQQLKYRCYDVGTEGEPQEGSGSGDDMDYVTGTSSAPLLEKLWTHVYPESLPQNDGQPFSVTAMSYGISNPDLLVAGYSCFRHGVEVPGGGRILCWTLRNPVHPERVMVTPSGVTALEFSSRHPQLLAVGTYSGVVAVYDMSKASQVPVMESSTSSGKHSEPVWQVRWANKGEEKGETLVSISTDGRILEWSLKKGFSHTPLMVLKRVGTTEGVISRKSSGLSLDFFPQDSSQYLVATEDGLVHRCSVSYAEQYLETYGGGECRDGHTAPVYRVRCSPFSDHIFVTCSADWTVKVWDSSGKHPLHTLHSSDCFAGVTDVSWSPSHENMIASVTEDGRIEIWDTSHSTLDPIVRTFCTERALSGSPTVNPAGEDDGVALRPMALTCLAFAPNAPTVAVGSTSGSIEVYRIANISPLGNAS